MKRRLTFFLLFFGAMVVALILRPSSGPRKLILPDGGTLELKEVTYGTTHVYSRGNLRNRVVRLLPERLRQRFGITGPTLTVGTTNIALWLERDRAGEMAFVVCDETGICVAPDISARMSSTSEGELLEAWSFSTFPRRQKEFTVRVFGPTLGSEPGAFVGEWKVPNPVFQRYPVWAPEPLPVTHSAGDLAVTLHALKTGLGWPSAVIINPPMKSPDLSARAVLSLAKNGEPTEDWAPVAIETSDATGNRRVSSSSSLRSWNGRHTVQYQWGLWPSESAWKLKVEVSRRANFPPDELWKVGGIPLPQPDGSLRGVQTNLQGAVVQLQRLISSRGFERGYNLCVSVLPYRADFRFSITEATDDLGRDVRISGEGLSNGYHTFDLRPALDAKSLKFTFALRQSRFVEFTVKPGVSRATNAAGEFPDAANFGTNSTP